MKVNDSMKDNNAEENIHEIYLEGCEKCEAGDCDAGLTWRFPQFPLKLSGLDNFSSMLRDTLIRYNAFLQ